MRRTSFITPFLFGLMAGCASAPTLEWSVVAGSGVDVDSIDFVRARITRGACAEAGELVWSGEVRRDGEGATFSSPRNLGAGTWCFAAVGGASDCAEIAAGEVERVLPEEREPFEVVLTPSPGPCVPVMDAGLPDGGVDGSAPMDAGPPGPVLCWPSPLPESPPPVAEPASEVYRTLRLPLEAPEFCPTTFSDARQLWGDMLCAELVGGGFVWSDGRPFDECVEAARYFEPSLGGGIEILTPISRPNEFMDYRACNVSYYMGEPSNATGSTVPECLPNTPTTPVTLLCERPSQGTVEVDPLATVGWSNPGVVLGRNFVAAAYDPDADRYLVVYGREDAIWWVFVGAYGEVVGTPALLAGEEGAVYRYPRVAVGETEAGETRFAVLWEEDGMRTGGPQLFLVLDGEGAPLIEPTYIVDPEMHEFWNNESDLAVGYEHGRHAFLFAGLAARQSEESYVYGKLQLRRARIGGEAVVLEAPFQLESEIGREGFFDNSAPMRVVHHPTRGETVVQVGTELLVFPEEAESPRIRRVVAELQWSSELVPVEGSDHYLVAFSSQVGWLDEDLGLRGAREWTRRSTPNGLLHFPADGPGAMAGTALVQSGDGRLRYLTERAEPCYPTSSWLEGSELSILVRNTDTGGFARFTMGDDSGLFATIFLSNGVRY